MSIDKPEQRPAVPVGNAAKIEEWFTYHPPTDADRIAYEVIRETAKKLAYTICNFTPSSADQTAALRKLRECVMTANAAIACKGV